MSGEYALNDPVKVKGDLDGIIGWIEGDQVGVHLTGRSVGKGTCDGTLHGTRRFECPAKCGIFVNTSDIEKRALSRLEELQLKRELASAARASSSTPTRRSAAPTASAPTSSSRSPTNATASAKDRLESIRKRREALIKSKQEGDQAPAQPPAASSSVAGSSASTSPSRNTSAVSLPSVVEENQKYQELESKLQEKAAENAKLQNRVAELESQVQQLSIPTPTKARLSETLEASQSKMSELEDKTFQYKQTVDELSSKLAALQTSEAQSVRDATQARAEVTALTNQLTEIMSQQDQRGMADAAHYKERAKLQATAAAAQRQIDDLMHQKLDMEAAMGELAMDKENLQEQLEDLQERAEEWKLDAETAQMELEEAKLELQQKSTAPVQGDQSSSGEQLSEEQVRIQNGRLREALIRLREHSTLERLELTRQLKALEKDAKENQADVSKIEALENEKKRCLEEINDLKDMVEQGSAFEGMVEDLSDRLLSIEEDNISLRNLIRELEEAAELTAELEEVQADELRALSMDLEGRDTTIRNLEEAIRLQRRREEDFKRTTTNYRNAVDTLKQEKQALLDMQVSSDTQTKASQKALSRAAQWVADAARMRRREAVAALSALDKSFYNHLSSRMEALLPSNLAYSEVAAIKGELLASSAVSKAAASLESIQEIMTNSIRPQVDTTSSATDLILQPLSEDEKQAISLSFHQADFAEVLVDASSQSLRFLAAGQWPNLLSTELSTELGAIFGHTLPELDLVLSTVLKTIKEEDGLSIEQSNLGELKLAVATSMQNMRSEMERKEGQIVPNEWEPPAWKLLRDSSRAKIRCLAVASSVSIVVERNEPALAKIYNKLEQCASQASSAFSKLSMLDVQGSKLVGELTGTCDTLATESGALLSSVRELLTNNGGTWDDCEKAADAIARSLGKTLSILRAEQLNADGIHPLSPECKDPWTGLLQLAKDVQSASGDADDVNGVLRARNVENSLSEAVEKVPLLELSNVKVSHLEKTLSTRSKEIAMQNARMSELEKQLAKSSSAPIARSSKAADLSSSDEFKALKDENRVLNEAMEVMQRENEMYETEIRQLKDFKSPGKRTSRPSQRTSMGPAPENTSVLEATLYRPALQEALAESSRLRASATIKAVANLPPLPKHVDFGIADPLDATVHACRLQWANLRLVDLTKEEAPRSQLHKLRNDSAAATERLQAALLRMQ